MKIWLIAILLFPLTLFAQEPVFRANVNKNVIAGGETFQITFTLENAQGRNFKAPSFADFNVLGGPNQSSSMQFINGAMTQSIGFSYYLQPKNMGKYTINGASIEVNGKTLITNKVNVEVTKSGGGSAGGGQQSVQDQLKDNVFVRVTVDKSDVYQGEQLTATYKLYTKVNIANTQLTKVPSYTGFWTQDIEMAQNVTFSPETYNGAQYNVATIKKVALFPQRSGDLELEPMELSTYARLQINKGGRSIFDDFFGNYKDVKYDFESNRIKIKVKPLPPSPPLDYTGFVGELKMEVVLDKKETKTDDPVTISLRFNGTGNMKLLDAPKITLPGDFDLFDPKLTEKSAKAGGVISGSKHYDYLAVPRRPGTFKLPPVSVSYFDLSTKQYRTLTSDEFSITVTGAPSTQASSNVTGNISKEEVELLGQDIRYIKTTGTPEKKEGSFFGSIAFAGLYISPFLLFGALLVFKRREDQLAGDTVLMKRRGATKAATRRLKQAKAFLDKGEQKPFYDEVVKAIWGYLGDKLNLEPSVLSRETAMNTLMERGVSPELIGKTLAVVSECEIALFAPSAASGGMASTYEQARQVIDKLEEELAK